MNKVINEKPTMIQVINDLAKGGAETLLVGLLKDLGRHYNIVLVTLTNVSEFDENEIDCAYRYSLDFTSIYKLPQAVLKLRRIIKKHRPVLIASHLYWSTILGRLAKQKRIPFVFTVHQILSEGAFNFNRRGAWLRWLDKHTYNKRQVMIGVSQQVIEDYDKEIGITGKYYVLHNYVDDAFFQNQVDYISPATEQLHLVAVGNPKWEKNYEILPKAFSLLEKNSVSCDIYGQSEYTQELQKMIDEHDVLIYQKGKMPGIHNKLKNYQAFIMCSRSEGFGIAAAEAMATGLPLFLSDLKVLREISHDNAIFFHPENAEELAEKIRDFKSGKYEAKEMSERGKKICRDNYSKKVYLGRLLDIYREMAKK